jgi:hypothetical protein
MKPLIPVLFVFLTSLSLPFHPLHAQAPIPNGDFEDWANGAPVGWYVDNEGTTYTPVTQTSDAEHGSSALLGTVISLAGIEELAPLAITGSASVHGFPYTDQPNSLTGYYMFNPMGSDSLEITCVFSKNDTGIGAGELTIGSSAASYTAFAVPIYWAINEAPDTAIVSIKIPQTDGLTSVGSTMYVDNLAFSNQIVSGGGNAVAPSATSLFALQQNYPNPSVNALSTSIQYSLDEPGYATLTVYDINGRIVETPVQEVQSAGNHLAMLDCSGLAAGVYTYRLTCGNNSTARMMQVLH